MSGHEALGVKMRESGTPDYQAPSIVRLGSIHEFTQQQFNKIGFSTDIYTALTAGQVVGSVVPAS
jgi:serine/threonine protein kinase